MIGAGTERRGLINFTVPVDQIMITILPRPVGIGLRHIIEFRLKIGLASDMNDDALERLRIARRRLPIHAARKILRLGIIRHRRAPLRRAGSEYSAVHPCPPWRRRADWRGRP